MLEVISWSTPPNAVFRLRHALDPRFMVRLVYLLSVLTMQRLPQIHPCPLHRASGLFVSERHGRPRSWQQTREPVAPQRQVMLSVLQSVSRSASQGIQVLKNASAKRRMLKPARVEPAGGEAVTHRFHEWHMSRELIKCRWKSKKLRQVIHEWRE